MIITREAKLFHSMIALMKCAQSYADYLTLPSTQGVHYSIKHDLKGLFNRFKLFQQSILKGVPDQDVKQWQSEWDRDYNSASAVFENWCSMTDEQREDLEKYSYSLINKKKTA